MHTNPAPQQQRHLQPQIAVHQQQWGLGPRPLSCTDTCNSNSHTPTHSNQAHKFYNTENSRGAHAILPPAPCYPFPCDDRACNSGDPRHGRRAHPSIPGGVTSNTSSSKAPRTLEAREAIRRAWGTTSERPWRVGNADSQIPSKAAQGRETKNLCYNTTTYWKIKERPLIFTLLNC